MKHKAKNMVPFYVTVAVLLFALLLHCVSRTALQDTFNNPLEQIEAVTYDARVRLGAFLNDPNYVAKNLATIFFDDTAVEQVNDGTLSLKYAPAKDQQSAHQL